MFYRYISENLCNYINSGEADAGNIGFDFAKISDEDAEEAREGLVEEKGFFILPSELFCNVRADAANDENLNETLERVFRHIEESAQGSLHDVGFDKFNIACEDTLLAPQHWDDEPFELIVSNPPYSIKWAGTDNPLLLNDPRFYAAGVLAPKSKADMAFIMHSLSWLASIYKMGGNR